MIRFVSLALGILAVGATGSVALAGSIEGVYRYGGKDWATVKVVRGKSESEFVGIVVSGSSDWHRQQVNLTVLELSRVGENRYRGRCSAHHVRASDDMGAWLEVMKAEVLDTGDLHCLMKIASGGSVQIAYKRVSGPESDAGAAEKREPGELAGSWRHPDGLVVCYRWQRDSYVGQVVALSRAAEGVGFRVGDEIAHVKRTAPGVYKGTVEVKSDSGRAERQEGIEITVRGDRLTSFRVGKGTQGKVEGSAVRLSDYSADPEPEPIPEQEEGDLRGMWRAPNGDVTRYSRSGNAYTGYVVRISPLKEGFGFRIGEESIRLKRLGGGIYVGTVKVKSLGGKATWWEDIEVTVGRKSLKYTRHMRNGREEKGSAVRVGRP